jgi:hypothetical protein
MSSHHGCSAFAFAHSEVNCGEQFLPKGHIAGWHSDQLWVSIDGYTFVDHAEVGID